MKVILAATSVVAALAFSSCIGRSARSESGVNSSKASQKSEATHNSPRAVIALVDATGSYDELVPALRRLAKFAGEELKSGDTFCAFWVKGEIGESPDFIVEPITLPVPQRRIGDPAEVDVLTIKKQIQTVFANYAAAPKFKKTGRTDLVQAIAYAGRMLHAPSRDHDDKWILLFSDLEDNQRKDPNMALDGINIRVLYVPARNDLNGLEKKIQDWRQRLTDRKAASVSIYDAGQTQSLEHLLFDEGLTE